MVSIQKVFAAKLDQHTVSSPISRSDSTATTLTSAEKSPLYSLENSPKAEKSSKKRFTFQDASNKRSLRSSKQVTQSSSSKSGSSKLPELLEKYKEISSQYRDEEFTQQACSFIAKISNDDSIPCDIQGKFSLYYILVSIAKIFMFNEYEIAMYSCMLDRCEWNIDEVVREEEGCYLSEFPCSLEVEITKESRQLIIYLLVLAFTLKNSVTDKDEMELIQAYCEKICRNFQDLVKRSVKSRSYCKPNFSHSEVMKKFRFLSKRDNREPFMKGIKDYNMVVESILRLTGSHTLKPKTKLQTQRSKGDDKSKIFEESHTGESIPDTDIFYADFNNDFNNVNNMCLNFSHQGSAMICEEINTKREPESDLLEEEAEAMTSKKLKISTEDFFSFFPSSSEQNLTRKDNGYIENNDNFLEIMDLSRRNSNYCHSFQEEVPLFSRIDSNYSLFGK